MTEKAAGLLATSVPADAGTGSAKRPSYFASPAFTGSSGPGVGVLSAPAQMETGTALQDTSSGTRNAACGLLVEPRNSAVPYFTKETAAGAARAMGSTELPLVFEDRGGGASGWNQEWTHDSSATLHGSADARPRAGAAAGAPRGSLASLPAAQGSSGSVLGGRNSLPGGGAPSAAAGGPPPGWEPQRRRSTVIREPISVSFFAVLRKLRRGLEPENAARRSGDCGRSGWSLGRMGALSSSGI